jgi:hypothetical protein
MRNSDELTTVSRTYRTWSGPVSKTSSAGRLAIARPVELRFGQGSFRSQSGTVRRTGTDMTGSTPPSKATISEGRTARDLHQSIEIVRASLARRMRVRLPCGQSRPQARHRTEGKPQARFRSLLHSRGIRRIPDFTLANPRSFNFSRQEPRRSGLREQVRPPACVFHFRIRIALDYLYRHEPGSGQSQDLVGDHAAEQGRARMSCASSAPLRLILPHRPRT